MPANQGLLEFVEMFKAPIKVLHPLLTATQEGNFKGTEGFGAIPFDGVILAHSNESEWKTFRKQQEQRGLPRPHLHRQGALPPARQRRDQDLREAAAQRLVAGQRHLRAGHAEDDGQFAVLTRAEGAENSSLFSKMLVYDGENLKDTDPRAKSYPGVPRLRRRRRRHERHPTRFAFKILSKVFNFDSTEVAANPVHLMYVLEQQIEREQFPPRGSRRSV